MNQQEGFTIIEVSLFLAISASLILLVAGLQTMVSRQRFQDTMNSLRTVIQSEYEEVRSGINSRLGNTGSVAGTSEYLTVGKLIQFTSSSSDVKISYVVATGNLPSSGGDDVAALKATSLKVVGDSSSAYAVKATDEAAKPQTTKIQWSSDFVAGYTIPDDSSNPTKGIQALAILRSPISSAIVTFSFASNPVSSNGSLSLASGLVNTPVALLVRNAGSGFKGAAVCIDRGSSSQVVHLAIPAESSGVVIPSSGNDATGINAGNLRSLCGL
jgi:type II secretory pathway pseudopilin PulG